MKRSDIGWCDFSGGPLNFVAGCTPVSGGCENCYARAIYERFGRCFSEVAISEEKLNRLAKLTFPTYGNKRPHQGPLAFVCDTGDLGHPNVPSDFLLQAFETMGRLAFVDWAVLTKRPKGIFEIIRNPRFCYDEARLAYYYPNIWVGVTVEMQKWAGARIPLLLDNWPGICFVSVEPMLEEIDLTPWLGEWPGRKRGLDWVICGGESGPDRRAFEPDWADVLRQQCEAYDVPFFYKQGGALRPGQDDVLYGRRYKQWPDR